jgi:hypothetical protein
VRDRLHELRASEVAVVTFADQDEVAAHHARLDIPFPLLSDPERILYRRFNLTRGSVREVWNLSTLGLYVKLLAQGRRLRRPRHDTQQLGGDFVIGSDGRLVAAFWPRSPDDRPSVDALFDALE